MFGDMLNIISSLILLKISEIKMGDRKYCVFVAVMFVLYVGSILGQW